MSSTRERFQKLNVSAETTLKMRTLKGRTGLTPNITARMGLALSLEEPGKPDPQSYAVDGMEFNSYTLLGSFSTLIEALLRQRQALDGDEASGQFGDLLRAHVNRGVSLLYPRLKTIEDVMDLLPSAVDES